MLGTALTWVLNSLLGGSAWRGWRRAPYVVLLGSLLLFGFAPGLLTERIKPAAEDVVQRATGKSAAAPAAANAKAPAAPAAAH